MASTSKDRILQKIKAALKEPTPSPPDPKLKVPDLFAPSPDDLDIQFAENFAQLQGQFSYCQNEAELAGQLVQLATAKQISKWYCAEEPLKKLLEALQWKFPWHPVLADCHASITTCEALVARTGSILLSSRLQEGRTASIYAPIHICVAYTSQLVYNIEDALILMQKKYQGRLPSFITLASGPSRTADIEKTLVTGVHGPKEVFCFLVDQ